MNTRKDLGWLELLDGIAMLVLGILTLTRPQHALTGFVIVYGALALLTGVVDIIFYIVMEEHTGFRPTLSLVMGILSVLAGCALLAHPEIGLDMLLILFPVWLLTHCISRLTHLRIVRLVAGRTCYVLTLATGIIGIVLAAGMLCNPLLSAVSMSTFIGVDLILLAVESIAFSIGNFRTRR